MTPKIEAAISNLKSRIADESQVIAQKSCAALWPRQIWRRSNGSTASTIIWCGPTLSCCRVQTAAVIRVKETRRSLAMSLDCNARYCHLNPREGAKLAVAEAARNVVCSGARPLAITNCLNFASPERPEVMWAFSETIDGMAEACRELGTPVTGGNVSFYNETEGAWGLSDTRHRDARPDRGRAPHDHAMVQRCGRCDSAAREDAKRSGRERVVVGSDGRGERRGSALDLEAEKAVQKVCLDAIQAGLYVRPTIAATADWRLRWPRAAFRVIGGDAIGARIDLSEHSKLSEVDDALTLLFSESPSRIILSVKPENAAAVRAIADQAGAACA